MANSLSPDASDRWNSACRDGQSQSLLVVSLGALDTFGPRQVLDEVCSTQSVRCAKGLSSSRRSLLAWCVPGLNTNALWSQSCTAVQGASCCWFLAVSCLKRALTTRERERESERERERESERERETERFDLYLSSGVCLLLLLGFCVKIRGVP